MISIFAPFRSRSCIRSSRWPLILHYTFIPIIHFSTPRLRENTHFHFTSFIHSVFPQALFNAFPMVCFSFLRRVSPINRLKAERKVITPYRCIVVRSANIRATIRPHHPLVVQKTKNIPGWFIHVLAVYAFFQAHYIPGTTFVPHSEPLHFISLSFHAFTSAPHSFGSLLPFHSASSINSVTHYPSHFPTHFQRYVLFSAAS